MNQFYYYILFSLILETLFIMLISIKKKSQMLSMHSMVISMTFAMFIGLTIGVFLGSLHQGNLFNSTILSMFTGILVGLLCGIGLGLLPTIEGIMSGLMGGMMGAMLGEMIEVHQSNLMLIILLTISLCSLLLFFILPESGQNGNRISNRLWFLKPLFSIGIISSYLLYGFHLSKEVVLNSNVDNGLVVGHDTENNNNAIIRIETLGLQYNPSSFSIREGQPISLILENKDSIEHDFEIRKININSKSNNHHQHSGSAASDIHLHGLPKSQNEFTFIPLESGLYEFYCTIPGHKKAGMKGIMKVISDKG
jgi:uncharacterized cupredoxin-like copper-binding protein